MSKSFADAFNSLSSSKGKSSGNILGNSSRSFADAFNHVASKPKTSKKKRKAMLEPDDETPKKTKSKTQETPSSSFAKAFYSIGADEKKSESYQVSIFDQDVNEDTSLESPLGNDNQNWDSEEPKIPNRNSGTLTAEDFDTEMHICEDEQEELNVLSEDELFYTIYEICASVDIHITPKQGTTIKEGIEQCFTNPLNLSTKDIKKYIIGYFKGVVQGKRKGDSEYAALHEAYEKIREANKEAIRCLCHQIRYDSVDETTVEWICNLMEDDEFMMTRFNDAGILNYVTICNLVRKE
jgi:hypothetical protein